MVRARAKITSNFMHPKGICFAAHPGFRPALPDPQLQNPRNSLLFLWFRSLRLPEASDRTGKRRLRIQLESMRLKCKLIFARTLSRKITEYKRNVK